MIGVFDSGFGGLTIHRALLRALPDRDFVYLGDNRNAPYGERPPLEVLNLTCAAVERLYDEGCTLVILACNTASTVALRWIQQQWLPVRVRTDGVQRNVLGIVVPTIEAATGIAWDANGPTADDRAGQPDSVAIFATRRTVETDCYPVEICKRRPAVRVLQQACPELAGSIECGASRVELRALVDKYTSELLERAGAPPDSVILGCTHYPLVSDLFAAALPARTRLIHQPAATARALVSYLLRHPEYGRSGSGTRTFLSTGYSADALPLIERFWGETLTFRAA